MYRSKMTDEWKYINLFHRRLTTPFVWSLQATTKKHSVLSVAHLMYVCMSICVCVGVFLNWICLCWLLLKLCVHFYAANSDHNVHPNNTKTEHIAYKMVISSHLKYVIVWQIYIQANRYTNIHKKKKQIYHRCRMCICAVVYILLRRLLNWIVEPNIFIRQPYP